MTERDRVPLREHVDALFERDRSALEIASDEREKAAQALTSERDKAASALMNERDKTADALATALERQIDQGDRELREHITQQIAQIRAALVSADLLELERVDSVRQFTLAVQRELQIIIRENEKAIAKAERAVEKEFAAANEWRGQSADRERTQEDQMSKLSSTFLPREVAEAQVTDIRQTIAAILTRLDRMGGNTEGQAEARAGLTSNAQVGIAALGLLVAVLSIVIAVILANGIGP